MHGIAPDLHDFVLITGLWKCIDFQAFLVNQALHTGLETLEKTTYWFIYNFPSYKWLCSQLRLFPPKFTIKKKFPKPFRYLPFFL